MILEEVGNNHCSQPYLEPVQLALGIQKITRRFVVVQIVTKKFKIVLKITKLLIYKLS